MCRMDAGFSRLERMFTQALDALKQQRGHSLVEAIDHFCESLAKMLGEAVWEATGELLDREHLGWVFGQYRGTVISGERKVDYFVRPDLGDKPQNDYLLEFYWQAFGLGSSIGELFYRQVLQCEPTAVDEPVKKVVWHSLRVSLAKQAELSFAPSWGTSHGAHKTLSVPKDWLDPLMPLELFNRLDPLIRELSEDTNKNTQQEVENLLTRGCYRAELTRISNRLVADILAGGGHHGQSPSLLAAREFFRNAGYTDETAVKRIVQAMQLLALYWRWSASHGFAPGDLLVLSPLPASSVMNEMPRLGLALLYTKGEDCVSSEQVNRITEFLDRTLIPCLDELGYQWCQAGHARKEDLKKTSNFLGPDLMKLIDDVQKSWQGNQADAIQLLLRVLPVVERMSRLVPSFVHEGQRYAVDVLLGVPYHEQVMGRKLATLDKETSGFGELVKPLDQVNILGPIIASSYSLLDSQDIVLFGQFSPEDGGTVKWRSLLRLHNQSEAIPSVRRYEELTRGHGNLFAVCVGKDSKLRLFAGGRLLLEYWQNRWHPGGSTQDLIDKLAQQLKQLLTIKDEVEGRALSEFANLVQRISETPGAGALFVITPHRDEVDRLKSVSAPPRDFWQGKTLSELLADPNDTLYRLATMDGATAILIAAGENFKDRWHKSEVLPRRLVTEEYDLCEFKKTWRFDWLECLSYGSRRASALALAMQSQKRGRPCLCVVVSADGPIYLMQGDSDPIERIPPK